MLHILTRFAGQFAYPLNLSMLLIAIGILAGWRKRRRLSASSMAVGFTILIVFSNPMFAGWLVGSLERRHPPLPMNAEPADAIVLLGGGIGSARPPRTSADLTDASDREWYATRLYARQQRPKVIVCGSPHDAVALLEQWGVPRTSIIEEADSRTTRENAVNAQRVVQIHGMDRVLIVTSAMHMPRALATFKALGINAVPAPTDFRIVQPKEDEPSHWLGAVIPSADALSMSTRAFHEYLGWLYYRLRGWVQ